MPRPKQPEELKKIKRKLALAERLTKQAAIKIIDCPLDFREGHLIEMRRRAELLSKTCDWAEQVIVTGVYTEPPK